jgi:glycosyltransferase 2 family protein
LERPQPFKKWVSVVAVIGFVAFLVYLFVFTDFAEVELVIGRASVPIYILAFLAVIASVIFDALAWRAILGSLGESLGFWRMFELTWIGQFIDTLVPGGWVGDLFKTYLLNKEDKVHGAKATAAIIIKDVLELFFSLGSVIVGIVLLLSFYSLSGVLMTAITITLLFLSLPLVLVIYLAMNTQATTKLMNAIYKIVCRIKGERTGASLQEKLKGQIQEFHDGIFSIRKNPKGMIKPTIYQTMSGVFSALVLLFVFYALGQFIGFDKVLITNTIVSNIQVQGVMLAGFSQVVSSTIYNVLGIAPVLAIASSLLAGFAAFWFRLVISFGYFQLIVAERCVPFFCRKCGGWRSIRKKSCNEQISKPLIKMPE